MLSSIFGRKEAPKNELAMLVELFRFDDLQFLQTVNSMVCSLDPNGVSMLIVAYKNVFPMLGVFKKLFSEAKAEEVAKQKHNLGTIEGFFASLCESYGEMTSEYISKTFNMGISEATERVEPSRRRIAWTAQGVLLLHADNIATNNTRLQDIHAQTWVYIARNITSFRAALEHNILWSDEEMEWFGTKTDKFAYMRDEKSASDHCVEVITPRYLRSQVKRIIDQDHL